MALHVSPEILEQYHGFYSLALDGTTDDGCALVLENVPAAGLRAALEAVPEPDALRTVLIKSCPELQSLSFLENFPALDWVYVRRCPAVAALWDTARTPALRGLAVTDCKKLRDISGLDGAAALELAREGRFDLIILDVMMPEMDGLEACMKIREFSNVPIIMLTAKSEDADKLMGFECGADDYLTKPFNILELKARVRALLRRAAGVQRSQGSLLTVGKLTLNTEERVAIRDGEPVELTAKEYDLIELLMRNPRRVYSRENLMNVVWGYTYAGDYRTVDVHIRRLREKLEENPAEPDHILTKWGVGYYFKG